MGCWEEYCLLCGCAFRTVALVDDENDPHQNELASFDWLQRCVVLSNGNYTQEDMRCFWKRKKQFEASPGSNASPWEVADDSEESASCRRASEFIEIGSYNEYGWVEESQREFDSNAQYYYMHESCYEWAGLPTHQLIGSIPLKYLSFFGSFPHDGPRYPFTPEEWIIEYLRRLALDSSRKVTADLIQGGQFFDAEWAALNTPHLMQPLASRPAHHISAHARWLRETCQALPSSLTTDDETAAFEVLALSKIQKKFTPMHKLKENRYAPCSIWCKAHVPDAIKLHEDHKFPLGVANDFAALQMEVLRAQADVQTFVAFLPLKRRAKYSHFLRTHPHAQFRERMRGFHTFLLGTRCKQSVVSWLPRDILVYLFRIYLQQDHNWIEPVLIVAEIEQPLNGRVLRKGQFYRQMLCVTKNLKPLASG